MDTLRCRIVMTPTRVSIMEMLRFGDEEVRSVRDVGCRVYGVCRCGDERSLPVLVYGGREIGKFKSCAPQTPMGQSH